MLLNFFQNRAHGLGCDQCMIFVWKLSCHVLFAMILFVAFEDDVGVNLSQKLSTFEDHISLGKKIGMDDFVQKQSIFCKNSEYLNKLEYHVTLMLLC